MSRTVRYRLYQIHKEIQLFSTNQSDQIRLIRKHT